MAKYDKDSYRRTIDDGSGNLPTPWPVGLLSDQPGHRTQLGWMWPDIRPIMTCCSQSELQTPNVAIFCRARCTTDHAATSWQLGTSLRGQPEGVVVAVRAAWLPPPAGDSKLVKADANYTLHLEAPCTACTIWAVNPGVQKAMALIQAFDRVSYN